MLIPNNIYSFCECCICGEICHRFYYTLFPQSIFPFVSTSDCLPGVFYDRKYNVTIVVSEKNKKKKNSGSDRDSGTDLMLPC